MTLRERIAQAHEFEHVRGAAGLISLGPVRKRWIELWTSKQLSEPFGEVHMATASVGLLGDTDAIFDSAVSRHPKRAAAHALRALADELEKQSREEERILNDGK